MELNSTSLAPLSCLKEADNTFGPFVTDCGSFDFTLLFEQAILSILPSAVLLLLVPLRFSTLYNSSTKIVRNKTSYAKLATAFTLAALELTLLILWSISSPHLTRTSVPSAALSFLTALAILLLSPIEHSRSVRPSTLLITYLLLSLVLDIAQLRTLYLRHDETTVAAVFSAIVGTKLALLVLEAQEKRSYLKSPYNELPPESTSGIISRSFFWWLNSVFVQGYKRLLSMDDLYLMSPELASEPLQKSLQNAWNTRSKPDGKYTLPIVVARALKRSLVAAVPPRLFMIGFTYAQPFLISRAINFMLEPRNAMSNNEGYGLIAATGLIYLGIAISKVHYNHRIYRAMTMFRGAMVAMIFDHTLVLQDGASDKSATLTLTSTDIDRITTSMRRVNEIWANFIEVAIGIGLLARQTGWVSILPVVLLILCSQGSSQVAKRIGGRQKQWVAAIQQRVTATASMLGSMKAVRMTGLADIMENLIQEERIKELNLQKKFRWLTFWINVVGDIPQSFSSVLVFVAFALQAKVNGSDTLNTTQAFTALALISLVSSPAAQLLVSVPSVTAALGCFERIQKFLLSPSRKDTRERPSATVSLEHFEARPCVNPYIPPESQVELLPIPGGSLGSLNSSAVVIDQLDARPSPDSNFVLRDISIRVERGCLTMIVGPVGAGKSTLLKAILGEILWDSGSVSVATSRISYCSQSPWLFNATIQENITCLDVGMAIDEAWLQTVIHACALDQDLHNLPDGDRTLVGSRGIVLSGGQKQRIALARAIYARLEIVILDDVLSALDSKTEDLIVERLLGPRGILRNLNTTTILVTHATRHLHISNQIIVLNSGGRIEQQGTYEELRSQDAFGNTLLQQIPSKSQESVETKPVPPAIRKLVNPPSEEQTQDLTRRTGDLAIYRYYFSYIGFQDGLLLLSVLAVCVFALKFPQIILEWWTNDGGNHIVRWILIYVMLAVVSLTCNVGSICAMMIRIAPKTAARTHHRLLQTTIRASQSFFSRTDTGNILNRFSQDMTLIEGSLPQAVLLTLRTILESIATAALISTGSSYMALTIPFLFIAIYLLQNIYLKTSRQLRFLDLEAKSPLYSHFLETIEGAVTIRAMDRIKKAKSRNFKLLDASQKPYYLLFCIQRWLELVLDLIVGILAVVVVALAVVLRNTSSAALLGVALNNVLSFTSVLGVLVTFWTELETSLGAVARLKNFETTTPLEDRVEECLVPPISWPSRGAIEFRGVGASYDSVTPALQDLNMKIDPGQRIGIRGRTGSGKSTLLATLLRMLDLDHGQIIIDEIDISTVPRNLLRERLITIPQEPFLVNSSVRFNADPTATITSTQIISVLEKVNLWSIIQDRGGLEANMTTLALSKGQEQLFCLARAVLKRGEGENSGKILILDEPTSNMDLQTDALMQEVIRNEFKGCTILMVAHRLESIKDADMIAVMDGGRLVEFEGNRQESF